ncbi:hypothetical protein EGW08_008964 [Elysia chlorotica]|uniref:Uncharacterized protein n=1 Tax=Elysia chlorotica TaxID=188477 RepID=A0A433TNY4_ELYCH|nr:hypothetical protein EGW08_008964 [Elysia chlorotica]
MVAMETVCGVDVSEVPDVLSPSSVNDCLVIDCRSFLSFNQARIVQAVNIHCPPILKRRSGGFIALENIVPCETKRSQLLQGIYNTVLVYDESTRDLIDAPSDSNIQSVITSLLKQVEKLTVRFIKGGFQAVREECPLLCMNLRLSHSMRDKPPHKDRTKQSRMNEPSEILPHVYLGDVSHSSQRALLEELGITALLNVSSSCHNHFQASYTYKNVTVSDNMDADLITWFPELIDFIESVSSQQGRVLVHCRAGVSRSATVCIAYIMQKQGLSLDSAYEFVKSKRPVIDPNINFIRQLQKFETLLKSRKKSHSKSRTKPSTPLLLRPPPCSLAYSVQTHSAPLIACSGTGSLQQQTQVPPSPKIFTFLSTELQSKQTAAAHISTASPSSEQAQIQMEVSSPSPTVPSHFVYPVDHPFTTAASLKPDPLSLPQPSTPSLPQLSSASPLPEERLSPCSLSQTAASPSPVCHPPAIDVHRPGSLPLLQISTPLSPCHQLSSCSSSTRQRTFLLPSPVQRPSTSFLSSPALRPSSPHFSFLPFGPEEGTEASALNYPEIPRTPREHREFSFFGGDSPVQANAGASVDIRPSLHCSSSPAHSPYLGRERPFSSAASLPHSPVSPLGFPLSPLHSPLPSCG